MSNKYPLAVTPNEVFVLRSMRKDWSRWRKLEGGGAEGLEPPATYQGAFLAIVVSDTGIPAAESKLLPGRGRIRFRRLWHKDNDYSQEDMEIVGPDDKPVLFNNLRDEDIEHPVYNISTTQEWVMNDIVVVMPLAQGRFVVVPTAGGNLRHATITNCLSNGYYEIILSDSPTFTLPVLSTGTGITSTGTGTGDGHDCGLCQFLDDPGDGSCPTLTQPTRETVPINGEQGYAYDLRRLSLPLNAHVVVANMGDLVDTGATFQVTGTGSGTGVFPVMETLWIIQTAGYELVAIPDRFYRCCKGIPTLVRCDSYITEGDYCRGTEIECPTGTGS